jgi:transposase-like protein
MKRLNRSPGEESAHEYTRRRTELLAAFKRSGLSAAAFARQHGVNYGTFCGWRSRHNDSARALPKFVEVEMPDARAPVELVIEVGTGVRVRVQSAEQLELAVRLLAELNAMALC